MKYPKIFARSLLYGAIVVLVTTLVISIKRLLIFVADEYIYSIPVLGDLLRGIEVIELSNLILFAVLGGGFGIAASFLPKPIGRKISIALLVSIVPLVFSVTGIVRYRSWVREFAIQENLSLEQAKELTNSFLKNRVGSKGFLGFYVYTAQFPVIPTNQKQMQEMEEVDQRVQSRFSRLIGSQSWILGLLFSIQGWLIRLFYFALSVLATVFHFHEGMKETERLLKRKSS